MSGVIDVVVDSFRSETICRHALPDVRLPLLNQSRSGVTSRDSTLLDRRETQLTCWTFSGAEAASIEATGCLPIACDAGMKDVETFSA